MGNQQPKLVSSLPTVIIIGGGYGGRAVAQALDQSGKVNVLVFERKDYAFHNIGAPRAAVSPNFQHQLIAPYTNFLRNGSVIQATVSSIDTTNKFITVAGYDGNITFDYLVVATGSTYPFPGKTEELEAYQANNKFISLQQQVQLAKHIVIVGGGPVGIEVAGEIATDLPNKKVTLIHSHSALLDDGLSSILREECKIQLERLGVKVVLDERVTLPSVEEKSHDEKQTSGWESYLVGERDLTTQKGLSIHTDLVILATGTKVNRSTWKDTLPLAEDGRIKVNNNLQVDGTQHIYAIGDAASIGRKMAYYAELHGKHTASNILLQTQSKPTKAYRGDGFAAQFVSIGRNGGAGQFPNAKQTIVRSRIVGMIKSKGLFVEKFRGVLNAKSAPIPSAPHYSSPTTEIPETRIRNVSAALKIQDTKKTSIIVKQGIARGEHAVHD